MASQYPPPPPPVVVVPPVAAKTAWVANVSPFSNDVSVTNIEPVTALVVEIIGRASAVEKISDTELESEAPKDAKDCTADVIKSYPSVDDANFSINKLT